MQRRRTDSRHAFKLGTGLAIAMCFLPWGAAHADEAQVPPAAEQVVAPGTELPGAALYLKAVLRTASRANRGRTLRRLARSGRLSVELPESEIRGELSFEVALLPSTGRAVRLARVETRAPIGARPLNELRLSKRSRRRLARLWVAAIELTATFTPDSGGLAQHRAVFLTRR